MGEDRKEGTNPEIDGVSTPQGAAPERPPEGDIPPPGGSKKKSRAIIVIAASVLVLAGAGVLAFFTLPSFHVLLHIHPGDRKSTRLNSSHLA